MAAAPPSAAALGAQPTPAAPTSYSPLQLERLAFRPGLPLVLAGGAAELSLGAPMAPIGDGAALKKLFPSTYGLPTAHFEGSQLFLLYPPHRRTEEATIREAQACRREGITVNVFLLSGWSQSREDIQFAYRLAETAKGRVFFTAGKDLDRFVVWDYVSKRRSIIG